MSKGIVPKADFEKMVRNAPPNSGITAESIAKDLQSKGYSLGDGLEKYRDDTVPNPKRSVDMQRKLQISQETSQQRLASSLSSAGDPLGKVASGLLRTAEYVASPIAAASGLAQKAILPSNKEQLSNDVQELPQQSSMARTSLPLTVGLATAPLSLPAAALATGVAGAAGRGLQETSDAVTGVDQQSLAGRVGESLLEGVVVGATDFAFGKGIGLLGKAGKKLLSPFASRFNDEIATLAAKKGMKLPVSAMSKSNVVKQLETVAQKGFAGGAAEEQLETATKQLANMSDDFVKKLGGSDDLTIAGKSVQEGADVFRDTWRAAKNKAYAIGKELLNGQDTGSFMPDTSATVSVIDEILSGKQAATGLIGDVAVSDAVTGILQTMKKSLTSGDYLPLQAFTSSLDELNQMTKFGNTLVSTGDQAILKKVIVTLDNDVTNGLRSIAPKVAKALDKADNIYKKGIELLDSSFGDKIAKLSDNPTKIVDQLITRQSVDDIPGIFELIGKGKNGASRIADVKTAFARKLLDSAKGTEGLIGNKLGRSIDSYGESTVRAVLGDDGLRALREIQKLGSAIDASQSVAKGSQTAFLAKISTFIGAVMTGNIPLAAGIAGGDVALSKLFDTQWFRQWLTKGFDASPIAEGVTRVGGEALRRAGVSGVQQLLPQ